MDVERLRVLIEGRSDLVKTFAKDAKAARGFEGTLGRLFKRFDGRDVRVGFESAGTGEVLAEAKAVEGAMDRLDGRDVTVDVNADRKKLDSLKSGFEGLSESVQGAAGILQASRIPFLITAVGGAVPAIAATSAAAAGLGLALGQGLAGGAATGGVAIGGVAVGLKAYVAVATQAVAGTELVRKTFFQAQTAQLESRRATILNTQAARTFIAEQDRTVVALTRVQAAVGERVLPSFARMMRLGRGALPSLTPPLYRMAEGVSLVAENATRAALSGEKMRRIGRVLDFVSISAVRGAKGLRDLGFAGLAAAEAVIAPAGRLQARLLGIAKAIRGWAESAEGARTISSVVGVLERRMNQTLGVAKNLGVGLFNVFDAVNRAGLAEGGMRGLSLVSGGLARITRRGTESRKTLDSFLVRTRELMPFAMGAVGAFVSQLGRVANVLIRTRNQGSKLTVLQETFRGLEKAARPLGNLLISTFRGLGPEIPRLVTNLAKLAETFAGSTGPLVLYVKTINRAMGIFNSFPRPVKTLVANLVALKMIVGTLGFGGAISGAWQLLINYRLLSGQAKILKAQQAGVAGANAAAGASAAASAGKVGRFARVAKLAGSALTLMTGPVGLAVAGVAALGIGAVIAYRRSETFRKGVDAVAGVVGGLLTNALRNAREEFGPVVSFFGRLGGAMLSRAAGKLGELKGVLASFFSWISAKASKSEGLQRIWEKLRDDRGAIDVAKGKLGPFFSWLSEKAQKSEGLRRIWTKLSDDKGAIDNVKGRIGSLVSWISQKARESKGLQSIWTKLSDDKGAVDAVREKFGQIRDAISTKLAEAKQRGTARTKELGSNLISSWSNHLSNAKEKYSNIRDTIGSRLKEARERGTDRIKELGGNMRDAAARQAGAMLTGYRKIRDNITDPIETAKRWLQETWNSILSGISKVLSAVGMKDLAGKVEGAKWEKGGTTEDGGGAPLAFARGGVVEPFARGGMGTPGKNPRVHLWNEQMGGEAFIAEKRPAREQLPYLQTAADWHGYAVVPAKAAPSSYRDFEKGGVVVDVRAFAAGGGVGAMYQAVKEKFGVEGFSRHGAYLSGAAARDSLDFMVTTPGTVAQGAQKKLGDDIAAFLAPPSTVLTIWYGQANYGNGWVPYNGTTGIGNANTLAHMDHVHGQAFPDQFRGAQGTYPGGGGGFLSSLWDTVGSRIWDATVGRLWDAFAKKMEGGMVLRQAVVGAGKMVLDGIKSMIIEKAGASTSNGKWDGGGDLRQWATQGLQLGNAFPASESNVQKIMARARQESGGDPRAVNSWDVNARNGTPSKGLMQIIEPTWESYTRPDIGGFDANWDNPIKSVAVASRYMKGAYGYVVGATGSGYLRGGVIPGTKGQEVLVQAHAGERVLSERNNAAFEVLAKSVEVWRSRNRASASRGPEDALGGTRGAIEIQTERMEAELRRQTSLMERQIREQVKSTVNAVFAAQMSDLGQEVLDRVLAAGLDAGNDYTGRR